MEAVAPVAASRSSQRIPRRERGRLRPRSTAPLSRARFRRCVLLPFGVACVKIELCTDGPVGEGLGFSRVVCAVRSNQGGLLYLTPPGTISLARCREHP